VILALLVAYHNPLDDELDGWCHDVLLQEKRWSEVRFAHLLLVAALSACLTSVITYIWSACTGGRQLATTKGERLASHGAYPRIADSIPEPRERSTPNNLQHPD
jgi:hypothetical protein